MPLKFKASNMHLRALGRAPGLVPRSGLPSARAQIQVQGRRCLYGKQTCPRLNIAAGVPHLTNFELLHLISLCLARVLGPTSFPLHLWMLWTVHYLYLCKQCWGRAHSCVPMFHPKSFYSTGGGTPNLAKGLWSVLG